MSMYAIVKTGGKQYRVEQGQSLLVERLPQSGGEKVALEPLLYVDGSTVIDGGEDLSRVKVEGRVVAHERGPKLRVVKFKPKRGYKRRTGHRQELTRVEVTAVTLGGRRGKTGVSESKAKAGAPDAAAAPRARKPAPTRKPRSTRAGAEGAAKPKATTAEGKGAEKSKAAAAAAEGAEKPKRARSRKPKAKPPEGSDGA
jgi:large subunit ribosomal protein L21